jgi:hypothetical protein
LDEPDAIQLLVPGDELTIEAIPTQAATAEPAPSHGWVLTRPAYRFLVSER